MKKIIHTLALFTVSSLTLLAADAEKTETAAKPAGKLVPLMTMEQAFAKALQTRHALAQLIVTENEKAAKLEGAQKEELEKKIQEARQKLNALTTYMDAIYGLAGKRTYEYNHVTSEIYLRVGTVTEVFTRALAVRDELAKQITATKAAIEKEQDAAKKAKMETVQKNLEQRHTLIANALFAIFQIHPARKYQFDAQHQQLYVIVSEEEAAKIEEQAKKNAENQSK